MTRVPLGITIITLVLISPIFHLPLVFFMNLEVRFWDYFVGFYYR